MEGFPRWNTLLPGNRENYRPQGIEQSGFRGERFRASQGLERVGGVPFGFGKLEPQLSISPSISNFTSSDAAEFCNRSFTTTRPTNSPPSSISGMVHFQPVAGISNGIETSAARISWVKPSTIR